jgi:peroxiredoxin
MKRYFIWSLLFLLLAVPGCNKEQKQAPAPLAGNPAPDFTVRDLDGREVRLADLRGKVVVLNFWATWCPPCREEIPSMMQLNKAMAGKPYRMLALSIDDGGKKAVEDYFAQSGTKLPAFLDPGQAIGNQYGITGVPETFVIDKKGVIVKKVVGGIEWNSPEVIKFFSDFAMK